MASKRQRTRQTDIPPRAMYNSFDQSVKLTNHDSSETDITTGIPAAPVTVRRQVFVNPPDSPLHSPGMHPAYYVRSTANITGTSRANIAATLVHPSGTQPYARENAHRTVLQQHCDFFDRRGTGVLWPSDTFIGFHALGFNVLICLFAAVIIHVNFSYATVDGVLPDPFFRVFLANIHRAKHGSDSGTYDNEGRFVPQAFENFWTKYAGGKDSMTVRETWAGVSGQRCIADPIGWSAAVLEWTATWILLWPQDGKIRKEDVRGVFDGSLFYTVAERNTGRPWKRGKERR